MISSPSMGWSSGVCFWGFYCRTLGFSLRSGMVRDVLDCIVTIFHLLAAEICLFSTFTEGFRRSSGM